MDRQADGGRIREVVREGGGGRAEGEGAECREGKSAETVRETRIDSGQRGEIGRQADKKVLCCGWRFHMCHFNPKKRAKKTRVTCQNNVF